ncbi:unnamed protein product [Prorocentrum cordatum]|uniref:Uncharacterized protein n=1 Tax=Prorocentrum cordatum TaxID=2364126 RepID=A0ABN9WI23_9DINO|nr:unnamed protein product [Polarella glacialis]
MPAEARPPQARPPAQVSDGRAADPAHPAHAPGPTALSAVGTLPAGCVQSDGDAAAAAAAPSPQAAAAAPPPPLGPTPPSAPQPWSTAEAAVAQPRWAVLGPAAKASVTAPSAASPSAVMPGHVAGAAAATATPETLPRAAPSTPPDGGQLRAHEKGVAHPRCSVRKALNAAPQSPSSVRKALSAAPRPQPQQPEQPRPPEEPLRGGASVGAARAGQPQLRAGGSPAVAALAPTRRPEQGHRLGVAVTATPADGVPRRGCTAGACPMVPRGRAPASSGAATPSAEASARCVRQLRSGTVGSTPNLLLQWTPPLPMLAHGAGAAPGKAATAPASAAAPPALGRDAAVRAQSPEGCLQTGVRQASTVDQAWFKAPRSSSAAVPASSPAHRSMSPRLSGRRSYGASCRSSSFLLAASQAEPPRTDMPTTAWPPCPELLPSMALTASPVLARSPSDSTLLATRPASRAPSPNPGRQSPLMQLQSRATSPATRADGLSAVIATAAQDSAALFAALQMCDGQQIIGSRGTLPARLAGRPTLGALSPQSSSQCLIAPASAPVDAAAAAANSGQMSCLVAMEHPASAAPAQPPRFISDASSAASVPVRPGTSCCTVLC